MSNSPLPSANKAASALLHLGLTLTAVLALMFFLVHFGTTLHASEALLYGLGTAGAVLILRSLVQLGRELAAPMPPAARRPARP